MNDSGSKTPNGWILGGIIVAFAFGLILHVTGRAFGPHILSDAGDVLIAIAMIPLYLLVMLFTGFIILLLVALLPSVLLGKTMHNAILVQRVASSS